MTILSLQHHRDRYADVFARLVDRDLDRVWRFLDSLVRDRSLARDLCHDVFVRIHAALAKGSVRLRGDGLPAAGYVFAAARHAVTDHRRRHATRVVPLQDDDRPDPEPAPDAVLERDDLRAALDAALAELDEDLRTVFVLSELEGLKYEEIAEALGVPPGTVASRKNTAVRRLRRSLEGMGHAV